MHRVRLSLELHHVKQIVLLERHPATHLEREARTDGEAYITLDTGRLNPDDGDRTSRAARIADRTHITVGDPAELSPIYCSDELHSAETGTLMTHSTLSWRVRQHERVIRSLLSPGSRQLSI